MKGVHLPTPTLYRKSFLLLLRLYLFLGREEGREKERERNIDVWLPLVCPPPGTWPTTQACARTGTEPLTLCFAGWCSGSCSPQPGLQSTF